MVVYNSHYSSQFYDAYGIYEWDRLETTAYGRLQAIIHTDFIHRHVHRGDKVLDAGCGPGRFTTVLAELGANVTALDISEGQLQLAEEKIREAGLSKAVVSFTSGDITNLSSFTDGRFDTVVCYGGPLSYVCDLRKRAASELIRVVRPGGILLISVMSRYGTMANWVRRPMMSFLHDPEGRNVWKIEHDGNLSGVPSPRVDMEHPPMHLYAADELRQLLPDCSILELAGSNVTAVEGSPTLEEVAFDSDAWSTAVDLERRLNTSPGLVDSGSHIILAAQRNS